MTRERFEEILNDNTVIKFNECSGRYFSNQENKLVVVFFFMHRGFPKQFCSGPEKRIMLSVCSLDNYETDIPLTEIKESILIMVNSEYPEYAMTFIIKIDKTNRKVIVELKDYPKLGHGIITIDEKKGLESDF